MTILMQWWAMFLGLHLPWCFLPISSNWASLFLQPWFRILMKCAQILNNWNDITQYFLDMCNKKLKLTTTTKSVCPYNQLIKKIKITEKWQFYCSSLSLTLEYLDWQYSLLVLAPLVCCPQMVWGCMCVYISTVQNELIWGYTPT